MIDKLLPYVKVHIANVKIAKPSLVNKRLGYKIRQIRYHIALGNHRGYDIGSSYLENGINGKRSLGKLSVENLSVALSVFGQNKRFRCY